MMARVCHLDCLLVFFSSFFPIPRRRYFYLNSIEPSPEDAVIKVSLDLTICSHCHRQSCFANAGPAIESC